METFTPQNLEDMYKWIQKFPPNIPKPVQERHVQAFDIFFNEMLELSHKAGKPVLSEMADIWIVDGKVEKRVMPDFTKLSFNKMSEE